MRGARMIVALALVAAGCATKAPVRVEPEMPTLDPPAPPPRVVAVAVEEEPEPAPVTPVPDRPATPPRPPARPARPEPAARTEPARPGPEAPKPTALPLTLSPSPGSEVQTEAAIRNLLARAGRDLARVNVAALNADGRTQYDTAQRFMQQAEAALKARNVVFAGKLADKAATLAAGFAR